MQKNRRRLTLPSLKKTTFVLLMYKQLTREQRYSIDLLLKDNVKKNKIAKMLSVSPSTITREIKRNKGKRGYSFLLAQEMAEERKERLPGNRSIKKDLWVRVDEMLREDWSPMQIKGVLAMEGVSISHQSIYTHIEKDKKLGGDLYTHCRHKLKHRKRPVGAVACCRNIPDRRGIDERPKEADGSRFGDWELDTIVGKDNKGAIVTLTERKTNFILMERLRHGKNALETAKVVVRLLFPYRKNVRTITTDNGPEFAAHKYVSEMIKAPVFFADPYSSWQKGAIENANKLIRQYIPKGAAFDRFSDDFIKSVQYKINRRPREKLSFSSPSSVFFNSL